MIKIECEAHELGEILSRVDQQSAERGAAVEENRHLKERIYALEAEVRNVRSDLAYSLKNPPRPDYETPIRTLITASFSGQKIAAIKVVREMTGLGLKEAKDLFEEAYSSRLEWDSVKGHVLIPAKKTD